MILPVTVLLEDSGRQQKYKDDKKNLNWSQNYIRVHQQKPWLIKMTKTMDTFTKS